MLQTLERSAVTSATKTTEPKIKNAATVSWYQQCVHRSRHEIFSEVKTVTPAMAEVILGQNPDNRRVRPSKLIQITRDMKAGRWAMNGEAIIIAKNGELNDGQHRLMGIVDSKVSLPMLFVFGVERDSRTTVDQGANRSVSDYLAMDGVRNTTALAAITRNILAYERAGKKSMGSSGEITNAEVLQRAETDATLRTSAKFADDNKAKMKRLCSPTVLGICHNVLLSINTSDGMAFMDQLCSGIDLQRGDAIHTCRERMLTMDRKSISTMVEIIFRAWNAYREKRTMRTIPAHGRFPELV